MVVCVQFEPTLPDTLANISLLHAFNIRSLICLRRLWRNC